MKKILLHILLLAVACGVQAQGIRFFEGSFDEALNAAKAQNKQVFVDFYTGWCVYCRKMAAEAFPDPSVGEYFNRHFINIKIDAESESGKPLARKYEVVAYPTLLIVNAAGEEVTSVEGGMDAGQLLKWVREETGDAMTFEQMYEKQKKDRTNDTLTRRLLLDAFDFLARQPEGYQQDRWQLRVDRLYADYRKRKPLSEWMNPEDFKILAAYHTETSKNDEVFEYVAKNYAAVAPKVGVEQVDAFLFMLNMQLTQKLAEKGDMDYLKRLERIKGDLKPAYDGMLKNSPMDSYTSMKYLSDASYIIYNRKNVAQYISLMDEYLGKLGKTAVAGDYSSAIQTLYEALNGKLPVEAARKGIEWITRALQFEGLEVAEQMELLIMNGDCYKMLPDIENARKCYKQAYAVSLQFQNPALSIQIQNMIDNL